MDIGAKNIKYICHFSDDAAVLEWELRCPLEEVAVVGVVADQVLDIPGKRFRGISCHSRTLQRKQALELWHG